MSGVWLAVLLATLTCGSWVQAAPEQPISRAIIRYDSLYHPVQSRSGQSGMVVSQRIAASEIGSQILAKGGNAIDAAVAVGFALAVNLPRAGNLGGSGFMLIYLKEEDRVLALDYRSAAPTSFDMDNYLDAQGERDRQKMTFGPAAAGVPGTVAGLYEAWQRYGSLPWEALLEPALRMAQDGIVVTDDLAFVLKQARGVLARFPASAQAYLKPDGSNYVAGELLVQPELAWSIEQIMRGGADAFYKGAIADRIDMDSQKNAGTIFKSDLAAYKVRDRHPLIGSYRKHLVATMPPVSAGGMTLLQMLNILERFPMHKYPQGSAQSLHVMAEVMKQSAANRRFTIGDPDYTDVPIDGFINKKFARAMAKKIDKKKARPVEDIKPLDTTPYQSRDTTHFSVVDKDGNAVANTYTLGYSFGSGYVVPGTGILLDNQIRNFTYGKGDHANAVAPGKRMVSTMTPTFVFDEEGKLLLVTGSPGGGRIINIVLQVITNVIDYGMNIAEATQAPRIHQQWRTPQLGMEKGFSPDTMDLLEDRGHSVEEQQTMGSTQSIMITDGLLFGAADTRRPGAGAAAQPQPPH